MKKHLRHECTEDFAASIGKLRYSVLFCCHSYKIKERVICAEV